MEHRKKVAEVERFYERKVAVRWGWEIVRAGAR